MMLDSLPPASDPRTVRLTVVPVTGEGFAAAGVTTVIPEEAAVTWIDAEAVIEPAVAMTVAAPTALGAV